MLEKFKKSVSCDWWLSLAKSIRDTKIYPAIDRERKGRDDHFNFMPVLIDWGQFSNQMYQVFCKGSAEEITVKKDDFLKDFYRLEKDWLEGGIGKVAVTRMKLLKHAFDELRSELKVAGFKVSDVENESERIVIDRLIDHVAAQDRQRFCKRWAGEKIRS